MGEVLIKAENVSKKFAKSLKKSLYYGVLDVISGITGNDRKKLIREDEFWAVKNISFEVKRGECLGLIGHNGAGKSTLLKMLNGLIAPDEGTITIKGKIGALIELGAGFNPILSGRENIYNNAAVIGFSKEEIEDKFDAIIAFSELEEFIDMPVQNYSSGMKVRLGFAIAAQMQPDVLIIDEVLAVGDLGFILKCFKQIDNLLPNTAMIFVSHSMPMVARICNQIILMERGTVDFQGFDIVKGISLYYNKFTTTETGVLFDDGSLKLDAVVINNTKDKIQIKRGEDMVIHLCFTVLKEMPYAPQVYLEFRDKEQRPIAGAIANDVKTQINATTIQYEITIKNILFSLGLYSFDIGIMDYESKSPLLRINNVSTFHVESNNQMWVPIELESECKVY